MGTFIRCIALVTLFSPLAQAQLFHELPIKNEENDLDYFGSTSDGKWLVGATYSEVYVWNAATGEVAKQLEYSAERMAINGAGGHLLLRDNDRDDKTGLDLLDIVSHTLTPTDITFDWKPIQFSDDGKRLLCDHIEGGYQVFDYPGMVPRLGKRIELDRSPSGIVLSPNGNYIAFDSFESVEIWNTNTGDRVAKSGAHISDVKSIAFSPDEKLLAVAGKVLGRDGVGVFHVESLLPTHRRMSPHDRVEDVAWTRDGTQLVVLENDIRLLDPTSFEVGLRVPKVEGERVFVLGDGRLGTTHYRGGPKVWDLRALESFIAPSLVHQTHSQYSEENVSRSERFLHLVWSRDGSQLALAYQHPVVAEVLVQRSATRIGNIVGNTRDAVGGGRGRRGQTRTVQHVANEYRVDLLDPRTGKMAKRLSSRNLSVLGEDQVDKLCFTRDGKELGILIKDAETFVFWDIAHGGWNEVSRKSHSRWPSPEDFDFSVSGKNLAFVSRGDLYVYDIKAGRYSAFIEGDLADSIVFTSVDEFLSGFSIWNTNPIEKLVEGPESNAECFVGNNEFAYSSGYRDDRVERWDLTTLEKSTMRTTSLVGCLALSENGELVTAGCADGIIRVWDVASRRLLTNLKGHTGSVETMSFHPKASILASASRDGKTMIWDLRKLNE